MEESDDQEESERRQIRIAIRHDRVSHREELQDQKEIDEEEREPEGDPGPLAAHSNQDHDGCGHDERIDPVWNGKRFPRTDEIGIERGEVQGEQELPHILDESIAREGDSLSQRISRHVSDCLTLLLRRDRDDSEDDGEDEERNLFQQCGRFGLRARFARCSS